MSSRVTLSGLDHSESGGITKFCLDGTKKVITNDQCAVVVAFDGPNLVFTDRKRNLQTANTQR